MKKNKNLMFKYIIGIPDNLEICRPSLVINDEACLLLVSFEVAKLFKFTHKYENWKFNNITIRKLFLLPSPKMEVINYKPFSLCYLCSRLNYRINFKCIPGESDCTFRFNENLF